MKLKDEVKWKKNVKVNADSSYGSAVTQYAETWANLMEKKLAESKKLKDIAKDTSIEAALGSGISGFQYGCAVQILAEVWEHGEELRRWNNRDLQIHDEGERQTKKVVF